MGIFKMAYCNCPNCYEIYEGDVKPKVCKKCGFPFKGYNENNKEYIRLFAVFNNKPTEELEIIINSEEYTDVAKRVALDIIDSGRNDYKEQIKRYREEQQEQEAIQQEKYNNSLTNPLYDDIHQIAGDLRFIKNLIIIGLICGFILGIIAVLGLSQERIGLKI